MASSCPGCVDCHLFHYSVGAERHDVIHEIVSTGNGMKYLSDLVDFFTYRYSREAEVSSLLVFVVSSIHFTNQLGCELVKVNQSFPRLS